jgi:5-methylcytosine-specific restriction endonuclease McrA
MQKKVRKFNITLEDYNKMFAEQEGCCAICNKHQSEFDKALAIDHDHKSGEVRGLLCMPCNTALGKFRDDTNLLQSAIRYLDSAKAGLQDLSPSSME